MIHIYILTVNSDVINWRILHFCKRFYLQASTAEKEDRYADHATTRSPR